MRKNNFRSLVIFSLLFLPFLFFLDPLKSYFSQDDFFHLRVIMGKNFSDIPSFFLSLQKEYAFYRPISRETFNLIMYKLFGLNPLPFHLVNLALIITISILVFYLIKNITSKLTISFFSTLLYSASAIHSVELYYLASIQTLLATLFLLVSLSFYAFFLKTKYLKWYFFSIIFYIFALLSHESSIVLPGIVFLMEIFIGRKRKIHIFFKENFKRILPFLILSIIYLFSTSIFSNLPQQQVYRPVYHPKSIVNTLSWYTIWDLGLSEMLVDFVGPKFAINPNLIKWYSNYLKVVLPLSGFFIVSIFIFTIWVRKKVHILRLLLFFSGSYVAALSPFLLFPQHKSTYYLSFSTLWISATLGTVLSSCWRSGKIIKLWVVILILAFITISFQTTQLNKLTYWAAKRAKAAEYLLGSLKKDYPNPPSKAIFYFKNDPNYPFIAKEWGSSSKQAFYILSGSDALKLLYSDSSIKTYFEDMGEIPDNINQLRIINYFAKFPY